MKAKIFLTGSTSYVGTKFKELYKSEFDILGVSRTDKVNPVDLLDFELLRKLFRNFRPDFILHLAADVGRDSATSTEITVTNPAITKNLVDLALTNRIPFLFTSTEAVYGDKEQEGEYVETDDYQPRSPYGESKVASEKLVIASGLPYLITRGHRHIGISKDFNRSKQFLDTLRLLNEGQIVHCDSKKLFTPVLINNLCDIFVYYMQNDADKKVLVNVGVDQATTYYDLIADIANILGKDPKLVQPDGAEAGWPANSTLSLNKVQTLHYPTISYQEMLNIIKTEA